MGAGMEILAKKKLAQVHLRRDHWATEDLGEVSYRIRVISTPFIS